MVRLVAKAIRANVNDFDFQTRGSEQIRRDLYAALVNAAESLDWDCQDEAMGIDPILDKILNHD